LQQTFILNGQCSFLERVAFSYPVSLLSLILG
jgi:hypothetical protein